MTRTVSDEVLGAFARRQHDWFRRVREGSLNPEEVARGVQQIIDRSPFAFDMNKDGWELQENTEGAQLFLPRLLELAPFLREGEESISGIQLRKRAKEMQANFGQRQAEYLLEHQEQIPGSWNRYSLLFPGTLWCDRTGEYRIPGLFFGGQHWNINFPKFYFNFGTQERLLCPCG